MKFFNSYYIRFLGYLTATNLYFPPIFVLIKTEKPLLLLV